MEENGDTSSVDEHSEHLVDILSEDITVDMFNAEANIIYYVAGFIARALKKISKCQKCIDIFGCDEETTGLDIHGLDEDCTLFVNSINRGGLVKTSEIIYSSCIASWNIYKKIMDNEEAKACFLSCKLQRKVFLNVVLTEVESDSKYCEILNVSCMENHSFRGNFVCVVETFFNVMAKNFASDINSTVHVNKKRSGHKDTRSSNNKKIRKLQSQS